MNGRTGSPPGEQVVRCAGGGTAEPGPTIVARRALAPRWIRVALVTTCLGLILSALGPFGSYLNDGLLRRSAYWVGATWLGLLLYGGAVAIAGRLAAPRTWRRRLLLGLAVLLASLPQTIATRLAAVLIWTNLRRYGPGWWLWYAQVATIGAIMAPGLAAWLLRSWPAPLTATAPAPISARSAVREDRPPFRTRDVIALQMEDHYVRVHTPTGSTLIHMRLTEAIEQVAPLEGLRIHRSWWVARHAVERIEGSPRSMRLHLPNGLSAPVARQAVTLLRQAGWLANQPVT